MSTWNDLRQRPGESLASAPGILVNTNLNDAAQFTLPSLSGMAGWIQGLAAAYQPASVTCMRPTWPQARRLLRCKLYPGREFCAGRNRHGNFHGIRRFAAFAQYCPGTPGGLQPPSTPTVDGPPAPAASLPGEMFT